MVVERTAKAKVMSAPALHRRYDTMKITLLNVTIDRILAVRSGAPSEVLFIIDVSPGQKCIVSTGNNMSVYGQNS